MPGPVHSWLYIRDRSGLAYEVINGARTKAYLGNPALNNLPGIDACQPFVGMSSPSYAFRPYLGQQVPGTITLPGTSGNNLSVPDAAALDITGDISIVAQVAPTLWAAGGSQTIVGKWSTASNLSYMLQIDFTKKLVFSWTSDGTTVNTATSTVAVPGAVDAQMRYVAVVFDVNNGAAGRTAYFWYSTDGNNWTAVGTPVTSATATSLFSGSSPLLIGAQTSSTALFNGKVGLAQIRSGSDTGFKPGGTLVFSTSGYDISNAAAATYVAATGQTVTVNKSGSPQTTLTARVDCASWSALSFNTPTIDAAPWYNANYPASADALGFWIEDWTGLDDGHIARSTQPWGGYGGGSALGNTSAVGRTMKININLFGRSEQAVEYLFRWLAATLTGVCSTCSNDSLLMRRYAGSAADPWDGVAEMRNVGLIEGLKWESEIAPIASCYVRRASFALMAGDPCMYLPDAAAPADGADTTQANLSACFAASVPDSTRSLCRPSCREVATACRTTRTINVNPMAAMAPIVTWANAMTQYSFPFRAICYADPGLIGPTNPCGLPILGELYVRPLPPGSSLRWDVVGRTVEFYDETTGGWALGFAYTDPVDPPEKRFFALPCGRAHIVMEPSSLCATNVSGSIWTLGGITYNPPAFPTVSVSLGERISCP